jgi:hypothetical protein
MKKVRRYLTRKVKLTVINKIIIEKDNIYTLGLTKSAISFIPTAL